MFFTKAPLKQKQFINFNSGCKQAIIILIVTVIPLKQNITAVQKCANYTLFWIIRFKIARHEISRFTHFYYHFLKQLYSNKKQGMFCCYDVELNLSIFIMKKHFSGFKNKETEVNALLLGLFSFYLQTFKAVLNNKS